ncbi:MAG: iron dicitrate transport regulator FecR [Verrucomicrobiota bacterium]
MEERLYSLLTDHLEGKLTEAQREELNDLLRESPEARDLWSRNLELHAQLHLAYTASGLPESMPSPTPSKPKSGGTLRVVAIAAAATIAVLAIPVGIALKSEDRAVPVATLLSSEGAAWESELPTAVGSELTAGTMKLRSGLATVRFHSGAELTIEAPAEISIDSPMRAALLGGKAIVEVPDSAHGFTLETPSGIAVDHGTAFAAVVDEGGKAASFEVLDGAISLQSPKGESVFLSENEAAILAPDAIEKLDLPLGEGTLSQPEPIIRISALGKTASIIRGDQHEHLHPDYLMVKLEQEDRGFERRAFLSFSLSHITEEQWASVDSTRLRLNLVPCGLGYRSRLEPINVFSVYGIARELSVDWQADLIWKDLPALDEATRLGQFSIARSELRGSFGFASSALTDFLRANASEGVTLIIARDTAEVETRGLVHAFASDSHPEASGPSLELLMNSQFIAPSD